MLEECSFNVKVKARGAYLFLVPQERALIQDRALISFLKNNRMFKTKTVTYGECSVNVNKF